MASVATRYYCIAQGTSRCVQGATRKPAGKCRACGGTIRAETGRWAVFVWRGDGHYRPADAKRTYAREPAAARYAERDPDLVVRWLAHPTQAGQ